MKKLLIIAAACTLMVSCKWWHETFSSPEKCAQWYCEEMLDALKDGDEARLDKLERDSENWYDGLSESDQEKAEMAMEAFYKKHKTEIQKYH